MNARVNPGINIQNKTQEFMLLLILAFAQFLFLFDYILILSLGDKIIVDLHIHPKELGYLISAYSFSAALAVMVSSFYIDRFDRKTAFLVVNIGFAIGCVMCFFANDIVLLIVSRIIVGAFGSVLASLIMIIIGDIFPVKRLGRATSFVISANGMASVIGVPVGLYFATKFGWHMPFLVLVALSILIIPLIYLYVPFIPRQNALDKKTGVKKILSVLLNKSFKWPIIFMSIMTFAGGFTILPFLSVYLTHNFEFHHDDVTLLFFLGGMASFLIGPLIGFLSDKFGKQNVFLLINFLSIIPILLVTIYPFEDKIFILFATTLFFMLSSGRFIAGISLVNIVFTREYRGRFLSLTSSIQQIFGALGTFITGSILYLEDGQLFNFDIIGVMATRATVICIFAAFVLEEK